MSSEERQLNLAKLRSRKLCIITGNDVELELVASTLALSRYIKSGDTDEVHAQHKFYLGGFQDREGHNLYYYLTCCSKQGIQSFAAETAALFSLLKPKYAIHIGTCAGISGQKIALGDVVFGQTAFNYEEGKWAPKKGDDGKIVQPTEWEFLPLPSIIEAHGHNPKGFVEKVNREDGDWKYGAFVSGCAVRMDAHLILNQSKQHYREAMALDMEASAFLHVCRHLNVTSLGIVKGVSDLGENKGHDGDRSQHSAIVNAAEAAKFWVVNELKAISESTDQTREPGIVLAKGYYDNYIHFVMDGRDDIWNKSGKISTEVEGLKIILPPKNRVDLYAGKNTIKDAVKQYSLTFVLVGDGLETRTSLLKGSFLIDFARTVTALKACADSAEQLAKFKHYIERESSDEFVGSATVEVLTWDDFKEWAKSAAAPATASRAFSSDSSDLESGIDTPRSSTSSTLPMR